MGESYKYLEDAGGSWLTWAYRNMGVLQTTVAEIVKVKKHQRM